MSTSLTSYGRRCRGRLSVCLLSLLLAAACEPAARPAGSPRLAPRFFALLRAGDSVYAQKQGYQSFARAQRYYDSAQVLAQRSRDTLLLAEAAFAQGRIYDAWNRQPHKTVAYFEQAAALFRSQPAQWRRYYYARFLVAHAYDKVPDSLRAVQALRQLRTELLREPAARLRQVPSTVEMALTATQVRNYPLADSLLRQLTRRAWVRNDPETYDYLDHYYLVQARLEVLYRRRSTSPYLDSLRRAYRAGRNPFDREYYGQNLATLYAQAGRYPEAYAYMVRNQQLNDSLTAGPGAGEMRQALLRAEGRADRERHAAEGIRSRTLLGLSLALAIISLLSFYLARQRRLASDRAVALTQANQALDEKVAQVELLNKEIQHRVKNNLHMIFSLLQMQERRTENEEVLEQLQAARLRVESIAALHNQLLAGRPDGPLDLSAFLKELISAVVNCLANEQHVVTHLLTDDVRLPANGYVALSLILNEWVTNSIKYARPVGERLEITVRVRNQPGQVRIEYADNGQPPTPADAPEPGLGSQIIGLLSRQLGATLRTLPAHPYHYELLIPHGTEN